jgi:hypothetical protein
MCAFGGEADMAIALRNVRSRQPASDHELDLDPAAPFRAAVEETWKVPDHAAAWNSADSAELVDGYHRVFRGSYT